VAEQEATPAGGPAENKPTLAKKAFGRIGSILSLFGGAIIVLALIIVVLHWGFGPDAQDFRLKLPEKIEKFIDVPAGDEGGYISLTQTVSNEAFEPVQVVPEWLRWLYDIEVYYSVQLGLQDGSKSLGSCFSVKKEWQLDSVNWRFSADGNLMAFDDRSKSRRVVKCKTPAIITPNTNANYDVWVGTKVRVSSKPLQLLASTNDEAAKVANAAEDLIQVEPDLGSELINH